MIKLLAMGLVCTTVWLGAALAQADVTEAEKGFRERYPNVEAASFRLSPVKGLYEVVTGDWRIMYYSPEGGHLLVGAMLDPQGNNLTAGRQREIGKERVKNLPLDKAVRIGNGKKTVIEIADPDCPYCRKAAKWFKDRGGEDISRYVFLVPLQMHPEAPGKINHILCGKTPAEQAKAYEEVIIEGKLDQKKAPECGGTRATEAAAAHQKIAGDLGVNGTPQFWVDGVHVQGANIPMLQKLLNEGR